MSTRPPMTPLSRTAARKYLGKLVREDGQPVPDRTFTGWTRSKAMPHRRLGRELIFFREELDRWLESLGRGFFA